MVEIIHISDLHFGSEFVPEYMENIINYIKERRGEVDCTVISGDLIHKGRVVQFKKFLPYLDRLREITKVLVVPGNHDAKNSGLIFFEKLIGPRRSRLVLEDKDTIIVGVNSARDDMAEGRIGDEQLDWLGRQFNMNLENRVLVLHHHLIPTPLSGQKFTTVRDAGEVLELAQLFEIDLVLMGHRHVAHSYVISWTDSSSTTFLYSGTSTSNKVRADDPPSFNHIKLHEGNLEVYMIDSTNLNKNLLLERREHHTHFMRPRKARIEHLLASKVWDE